MPLTRALLREHVEESTFKLRPAEYAKKYPKWPGQVGLEIEMLPVYAPLAGTNLPRSVPLQGDRADTIASILRAWAEGRKFTIEDTKDDHGQTLLLRILLDQEDNVSFEPGGQVEFSSKPYPCLSDAVRRLRSMQTELDRTLGAHAVTLVQTGINPWHTIPEIGLQMAKGRYRAMDRYFSGISPYGQRMMRQTCTVQVNLDFGPDEETLAKRYLASMLLAPIAAATFAYSPVVDREKTGIPGFRTRVWRHVDPGRTGLPGLERVAREMTREACIATYLDFALDAPVVFIEALDYRVPAEKLKGLTFAQWLETPVDGVSPTLADFKTHMTLLFPEVRARGFLELRSIDCQPRAFEAVPAEYMTGLLYDGKTLDRVLELLLPIRAQAVSLLAGAERGLAHPQLAKLAKDVMALARAGFANLPSCFIADGGQRELAAFQAHFTDRGRTPADDLMDRLAQSGGDYLDLEGFQRLEAGWEKLKS